MDPTPEQVDILEAATTTKDNLMIVALAGVGKTTTLEMVSRKIVESTLFLAFNKRVVDEAKKRLPSWCEPRTMNSVGHSVWAGTCGRKLIIDTDKMRKIAKQVIEEAPERLRSSMWENISDTLLWCRRAKRDGFLPKGAPQGRPLTSLIQWFEQYGEEPEDPAWVFQCLERSITQAFAGNIEFDDQLYMPVCYGGSWPRYPLVLCDEVQDLSPINHEMLRKLVDKRVMGAGDPWQSIYLFRGAVQGGMASLVEHFNMRELPLSYTWRVPKCGVERAQARVPHYRYFPEAPEGEVVYLTEWGSADVPDDAAIICRNNAPLFSAALKLLRDGRNIKLVGMDIGPQLVRLLKKLGPPNLINMQGAIESWAQKEQLRGKTSDERIFEKAECLSVLCAGRANLAEAIRYTEDIFKRDGSIQLLSIHKAKGLEWPVTFHLDPWRIPSKFAKPDTEEYEQELNCRYVAETRFKEKLVLVDMEGYGDGAPIIERDYHTEEDWVEP